MGTPLLSRRRMRKQIQEKMKGGARKPWDGLASEGV
ncbi:hypothetical protein PGF_00019830 [Porphyromonas gingivalis 381]|nr:hypothetical protein PGF_00019830 [Porphyromonas gingivalis 381]